MVSLIRRLLNRIGFGRNIIIRSFLCVEGEVTEFVPVVVVLVVVVSGLMALAVAVSVYEAQK